MKFGVLLGGCSFKKASNVQGVQTRVSSGGANLESSDHAANGAHSQSHGTGCFFFFCWFVCVFVFSVV